METIETKTDLPSAVLIEDVFLDATTLQAIEAASRELFPTGMSTHGIHIEGTRFHTVLEIQGHARGLVDGQQISFIEAMQRIAENRRAVSEPK